jgi:stage II sporulation protein D
VGGPAPTGSGSAGAAPDLLRLAPPRHGSFLVRGTYPDEPSPCKRHRRPVLRARYPGTLLVRRASDGSLELTVVLPFERYLEGLAEVPPSWPMAALEAQAIAARSYALATTGWSGEQGERLERPICATSACQVYRGLPLEGAGEVRRWYRAVRRTRGLVLLFQGRPAETVYFSTSDGRTYGNDEVFGSAPLPYLRPVPERDDGASPLSHWRVRIPFADLARFLAAAGAWPADAPIADVRPSGGTVRILGGGSSRRIEVSDLRTAVNTWAPCLMPGRYPPGGLPSTIPSRWVRLRSAGGALVATGRGWGHGVGMVQWGAYGKALRGWSASQILAFYYGGLQPQRYPEPGLIRVRVASGLTSLRIVPSAVGARVNGEPVSSGAIRILGGERLEVRAP